MSTIPASTIVNVVPSVLAAGGTGLDGVGLMLSKNPRIPVGAVLTFDGDADGEAYFGAGSYDAEEIAIYFTGFEGASISPSSLLVAQFPEASVAAYLRGGNISGLTLSQLQAINGALDILIDGYAHNASGLDLSAATSFSNAASIIQTAINGALSTIGSFTGVIAPETFSVTASIAGNIMNVTAVGSGTVIIGAALSGSGVTAANVNSQISGTPGGIGTYAVSVSQDVASTTITGAYGQLTATADSGIIAVGQSVAGSGVTGGTIITALGTGTGGNGTYFVNHTQTVGSEAMTTVPVNAVVTYDLTSGAFVITSGITGPASTIAYATGGTAAALLLTSATGAVLSQGANTQTPAAFMSSLIVTNAAWTNWMTIFDPDGGSGNTQKQAFSAWKNTAQGGNRFGYFVWDGDASPAASDDAAGSLGQILDGNGDSGSLIIWEAGNPTEDNGKCAFALGIAASINYQQTNGRADFMFRAQPGLVADVTTEQARDNLLANGYNFYGVIGAANGSDFTFFQNGAITGPFKWADSWQTQVWLNTFFQIQLLTLLTNSLSVPFTLDGIGLINQTCQTVIRAGLAFGAFAPNTLTPGQIAEVNEAAGVEIANSLQTQGYYLQIDLPDQTVQTARGPWPITFWYIDRNSVQSIDLSSVLVQ